MLRLMLVFALVITAFTAQAQSATLSEEAASTELQMFEAETLEPGSFTWTARVLIVFADGDEDPRLSEQLELIEQRKNDLAERDVVVVIDSDPTQNSEWRLEYRPRGFALVLIAKDGSIVFRKPTPWTVREITRSIDKLPLRQQELRQDRSGR